MSIQEAMNTGTFVRTGIEFKILKRWPDFVYLPADKTEVPMRFRMNEIIDEFNSWQVNGWCENLDMIRLKQCLIVAKQCFSAFEEYSGYLIDVNVMLDYMDSIGTEVLS